MRIAVCDGQRLFVDVLAASLRAAGHEVVAASTDAHQVRDLVIDHGADICLLDLHLAGDMVAIAGVLLARRPSLRVVALTSTPQPRLVSAALKAGVTGFARKDQGLDAVLDVIERVHAGSMVIDAALLRSALAGGGSDDPPDDRLLRFLTTKERLVLRCMLEGRNTREIALTLGVAPSTARTHVQNVLVKLGAHSRLQASAIIVQAGLLDAAMSDPP